MYNEKHSMTYWKIKINLEREIMIITDLENIIAMLEKSLRVGRSGTAGMPYVFNKRQRQNWMEYWKKTNYLL